MKQIISGVKYIHDKNILHGDIHADNILLHYDNEEDKTNNNFLNSKIKIIDFGFGKFLSESELTDTIMGSPFYMDPTLLKAYRISNKKAIYSKKYDVWGLGVLFCQLLTGKGPFNSTGIDDLIKKIENWDYSLPINFSEETMSFINAMLQYDRDKRSSIDELLKHDFLNKPISEFTKINPKNYFIVDSKIKMNIKKKV